MNEADQHLLALIQAGDEAGWAQFVDRYQCRLIAFAQRRIGKTPSAEDVVQDTFISFLKALPDFRPEHELESLLFHILRRRIVDHFRKQGRIREVPACQLGDETDTDTLQQAPSSDLSASWYARNEESQSQQRDSLAAAVRQLAGWLQDKEKLRDLKIAEGLFYARRRNTELASILDITENEVAFVKHRLIKRLQQSVQQPESSNEPTEEISGDLLVSIWEELRPSCPKRSTLGKYTLGILPEEWMDYVRFHTETLQCGFCLANFDELQMPAADETQRDRLFQSTVGFLSQPAN